MADSVKFWWGITDYSHDEIGFADAGNAATDGVRQIFTNMEQEGRVEALLTPVNLGFAKLATTIGAQVTHQALTAPSPDNPGLLNGLFNPNTNSKVAGYTFNEFTFTPQTRAQIAARIEHVDLHGTGQAFPAPNFTPGSSSPLGRNPNFTPASVSFGLIQKMPGVFVGSVTAQRIERAPKPAELFSRGAHDATGTFDIGNPDLRIETVARSKPGCGAHRGRCGSRRPHITRGSTISSSGS